MAFSKITLDDKVSLCRKNLFAFLSLFIIIIITYSNTFNAGWHFDDEQNIVSRKQVHFTELSWKKIKSSLFDDKGKLKRPISYLSFGINYYFGKLNVFGYHLVNISIHIITSIFLFLFIYNTLNLPILKNRYEGLQYPVSLLSSFLWAINPVHTQAITYIVQRMASMAGMFFIMSMFLYLKGRTSENKKNKIAYYILFTCSSLLAFGTKENTAMLPFCILLYDLYFIQGINKKNIKRCAIIFLFILIIPICLALIFEGPSLFNPSWILSSYKTRPFTLPERLLTEPRIIIFYISLLLYPMPDRLSICHDISISHGLFDPPTTIISIILIFTMIGISILKSKKYPFICYSIIFFFINHVIESTIFPLELIFEHRNYLPSMLFFTPISIFIIKVIGLFSYKKSMQTIFIIFIILVLVAQGHSTFMRNFIWKTDESLWIDATEKAPGLIRPWNNLGSYYLQKQMPELALSTLLKGLPKKTIHHKAAKLILYFNIGAAYQKLRKYKNALRYYNMADKMFYKISSIYLNRGAIYLEIGEMKKAEEDFMKALEIDPKNFKAYQNLGFLMIKRGLIDKAISYLQKSINISYPAPSKFYLQLGYLYRLKGYYGKAYMAFTKALEKDSVRYPELFLYLAELYLRVDKKENAKDMILKFFNSGSENALTRYINGLNVEKENQSQIIELKKPVLSILSDLYIERLNLLKSAL